MAWFIAGAAIVAAAILYLTFRRPPNQALIDFSKMSVQRRAAILLEATALRLKWENDNPPALSGILLDPAAFPQNVCNKMFADLLDFVAKLIDEKRALDQRLDEWGIEERIPDTDIWAVRVWMATIGARCGKMKLDDIVALWGHLKDAMPYLDGAMKELEQQHRIREHTTSSGPFLFGAKAAVVLQQAQQLPKLEAIRGLR